MQKSKSLLLKILMVVMVLCCALFSLAGCSEAANGKDGVDGAAGVGIQKVEIVDGELVVTLTNGTTQTAGSVAGANCGHDKSLASTTIIMLDGTDADACQAILHTCKECKFVTAEFTAHKTIEVNETPSTCTEQGYGAGQKCTVPGCNWTSSAKKDLLPHAWDEDVTTVYDEYDAADATVCKQGYSELKTCTECGETELIAYHPAEGHKGKITLAAEPSATKNGSLFIDCEVCGGINLPETNVMPKLSAEDYAIEIKETTQAGETLTCKWSTEAYSVADENGDVEAQEVTFEATRPHSYAEGKTAGAQIDNFDAATYKEIKVKAGQTLTCNAYADAIYECITCQGFIDVQVKKAHSLNPELTEEKIMADMKAKFACTDDEDAKNTLKYDCHECGEVEAVSVTRPAFDHDVVLDEASGIKLIKTGPNAGKYEINFVCKNPCCPGLEDETVYVKADDPNLKIVPSTCTVKGSVTYTDNDGKTVTAPLGLADHVACYTGEGEARKAVRIAVDADIDYADYLAVKFVTAAGKDKIECGKEVEAMFQCEDCDAWVTVNVTREHDFVEEKVKSEGDCKHDREVEFTCAYDDCDYADSKKETEGFVWGTYTETAQHKLTVANPVWSNGAIVSIEVTCSVCDAIDSKLITVEANELKAKKIESAECGKSGDEFTFKLDNAEYTLFLANHNIHKFAGKYFDASTKLFTQDQAKLKAGQPAPTCTTPSLGIVTCELCELPVEVKVIGEHTLETETKDSVETIKKYPATCTKGAYYKCTVEGCQVGEVMIESEPALGHKFELAVNKFDSLPDSVEIVCKVCNEFSRIVTVEIAADKFVKDTDTYCDKTVYTYADYEISATEKYTIVFYVLDGSHEFIVFDGEEVVSVWTEVANGKTNYVAGKYCTKCGKMLVLAKVDASTDDGKAWKNTDGSWKMSVIKAAIA